MLDARGLDRGIPVLLAWLARDGVIAKDQVPQILDAMGERGLTAEEAAVVVAQVAEDEIARRYSEHFHVPLAADDALEPSPDLATLLPADFCRKHLMVPLGRTPGGAVLAMADPSRTWLHAQITMMTGLELDVRVAPLKRVRAWIDQVHGAPAAPATAPPAAR